MRIFVTGTRGIPNIPGGVEKHCQELYPLIVAAGHEVMLATRKSYIEKMETQWNGVQLCHIPTAKKKSFEAIVHTFLAILKAKSYNPDIVHIHAVGPALLVPFARLLGLKVVFTNHGPDYNREKWGWLAKTVLWLGEKAGGKWANEVIVISNVIKDIIRRRCGRESNLIYNGVPVPDLSQQTDFLERKGIKSQRYLLSVARFVPEKGLTDLIQAFQNLSSDLQLVIAGDADHETDYSRQLKQMAKEDDRIILTGYITGEDLSQIYTHARLFVLPSYHEGLPIALLEAMSFGLPVLVSDIPANKEVALPSDRYFSCGDIEDLGNKINELTKIKLSDKEKHKLNREPVQLAEDYKTDHFCI
nr:glycosyltransferase family 4 protein [uncultured Desulfobacter sp.]